MRPTICSLFEPHHKQNLYTNPKRTAKSLSPHSLIDTTEGRVVQKIFRLSKKISSPPNEVSRARFYTIHQIHNESSGNLFFLKKIYRRISEKILVRGRKAKTSPRGVVALTLNDWRSACSLPAPDAKTHTSRATASAG